MELNYFHKVININTRKALSQKWYSVCEVRGCVKYTVGLSLRIRFFWDFSPKKYKTNTRRRDTLNPICFLTSLCM